MTLKSLVDKPVGGLLASKDLAGQRKFEASDLILKARAARLLRIIAVAQGEGKGLSAVECDWVCLM